MLPRMDLSKSDGSPKSVKLKFFYFGKRWTLGANGYDPTTLIITKIFCSRTIEANNVLLTEIALPPPNI